MSAGAAFLLALAGLVALAAASFFRHMLTALLLLIGLPFVLLLKGALGSLAATTVLVALVVLGALVHTITDTLAIARSAKRTRRRPGPQPQRAAPPDRSRIAA